MPITPFQHSVFYAIEKAIKVYRRFAQDQIRKETPDLTINQALLLDLLARDPGISQNEMAQILFKDLAAVTRMMEILVKRGYVVRSPNPDDRRKHLLRITRTGEKVVKKVAPVTAANRSTALKGFTHAETAELHRLLEKLITNCTTGNHE